MDAIVGATNELGVSDRRTNDAVIERSVNFARSYEPKLKVRYFSGTVEPDLKEKQF